MGMKRELTQTEVAYLAGILDGEGSISILKMRMKRKSATYWHYALQIRIASTHLPLIEWICDLVGGRIYEQTYVTRVQGNRKRAQHWHIGGRADVAAFLRLVRPYLIVKAEQADLALEFSGLGREFVPSVRAGLRERMRGLNLKGIGLFNGEQPRVSEKKPNEIKELP